MKSCKVKNCQNKIKIKGYCQKHYDQMRLYGKILKRTVRDKNEIINCGDYCEICIYNIKHQEIARAKIDKEDLGIIKGYKWYLTSRGSIGCSSKNVRLHQLILGKKDGFVIDHINHDTLDNTKQNLRHCTISQNNMNKKNVRGYGWNKEHKKWIARIRINYKQIHLGYFENKQDAITARRQAELKYFKEFAFNL